MIVGDLIDNETNTHDVTAHKERIT